MSAFLVDASLPKSTADLIRAHGRQANDVRDIGLGSAPDQETADHARRHQLASEPDVRTLCPVSARFPQREPAMGLYDNVRCKYPLPDPEAQDLEYQTKSTFAPFLENYIITPDGRLLKEEYDIHEEPAPDSPLGVHLIHENCRWVQADFRGELEIHMTVRQADGSMRWYSYLFWFKDNRVADLQRGNQWGQVIPPHKTVPPP